MVRASIKNGIREALNYDVFRVEDFRFTEDSENDKEIIIIEKDKYYFKISFSKIDSNNIEITCNPGKIHSDIKFQIYVTSDVIHTLKDNVYDWLKRLKEDIINAPNARYIENEIEQFSKEIDEKLKDMENEYFSREEGEQIGERLNKLEQLVLKRKNDEKSDKKMIEQLEKMKNEIEFLKETINKMSKKNWIKNAVIKFYSWSQKAENKELIEMGVDTIKAISQLEIPEIK